MVAEGQSSIQKGPLALLLLVGVVALAGAVVYPLRGRIREAMNPREPDVILIVMDTVRADHLHACGYDKPNTPSLDAMKASGWAVHCSVTSPAPWTIPSHVAFFSGRNYVDVRGKGDVPLKLAQEFQQRGYDTAFVSANMVLRSPEWFTDGFRIVERASNFGELKGTRYIERLHEVLPQLDRNKPAFLFFNLVDAHSPYPPIPPGVDWAPPQRGIHHRRFATDDDSPFRRFVNKEMTPEESEDYARKLIAGYDYGIWMADQNVGRILELLREHGRLERARIVVTADHGELLGEHDIIGHGDTLYEPGVRVPLFYWDTLGDNPVALPKELSGVSVWGLLRDGKPSVVQDRYVTSYSAQVGMHAWDALAMWPDDQTKLVWKEGETWRIDLAADPKELNKLPVGDHPAKDRFDALVEQNRKVIDLESSQQDPEERKMLQQAGYLAPDE